MLLNYLAELPQVGRTQSFRRYLDLSSWNIWGLDLDAALLPIVSEVCRTKFTTERHFSNCGPGFGRFALCFFLGGLIFVGLRIWLAYLLMSLPILFNISDGAVHGMRSVTFF